MRTTYGHHVNMAGGYQYGLSYQQFGAENLHAIRFVRLDIAHNDLPIGDDFQAIVV